MQPRVIIFDTSGLNWLLKDPSSERLMSVLLSKFRTRLSGTNIEEIAATISSDKRQRLIALCGQLLPTGDCIGPHHLILDEQFSAWLKEPPFDWKAVSVRSREYENAIRSPELLDDQIASVQLADARTVDQQFEMAFSPHRQPFEAIFAAGTETRPGSLNEFLARFKRPGGPFWQLGIQFFQKRTGRTLDEATIGRFISETPPLHAMIVALLAAEYERCVRNLKKGPSLRADRLDTFTAVYLPYCDAFISADERQLNCFRGVAAEASLSTAVCTFTDFRNELLAI